MCKIPDLMVCQEEYEKLKSVVDRFEKPTPQSDEDDDDIGLFVSFPFFPKGPPGTGKTFIGVKIVKTLLRNVPLTPIVICCLTNHALDQFLEHILKFTKKVVRLGHQSESNLIPPHVLENLAMACKMGCNTFSHKMATKDLKKSLNIMQILAPHLLEDVQQKYRSLLRRINSAILIVEEAAQVLESHIIASLLPSTQHLILIGDHKQLRAIPANYELSEVYNLKISMFERLFDNLERLSSKVCATLTTQHRMKPCIADLLKQELLYKDLESAESVYKYEDIVGVNSSVFFINHCYAENEMSTSTSCTNEYEAETIASLAKYFCMQSYTENQITILATYSAQVLLIQKYLAENRLEIKVTTVDNYQGEKRMRSC
ncbi:NFX1-type zinc finger-containing protein 1 [Caerostris extrusa]|uniref:NFX1-type zinc finger-containing protein 1 n=1 Tax=Caerostris extrusa TaxID=172846 RepID=A0AAV4P333_CAEEX|nr:NFX1-type zinc finger-containing protein 1 [Caerostris extrusa]